MNRLWELGKKRWWYFFNVGLGVIYGVDLFFLKDPDETKWDNIIDGFLCVFHIALFFAIWRNSKNAYSEKWRNFAVRKLHGASKCFAVFSMKRQNQILRRYELHRAKIWTN